MSEMCQNEESGGSKTGDDCFDDELAMINTNVPFVETSMNLSLLDSHRWGWSAVGGISDLLTPHERAKRKSTKKAILQSKNSGSKRTHDEAFQSLLLKPTQRKNVLESGNVIDNSTTENTNDKSDILVDVSISSNNNNLTYVTRNTSTLKTPGKKRNNNRKQIFGDKRKNKRNKSSSQQGRGEKIRYKSLQKNQTQLDIKIYHKGREGIELRDDKTGELIFNANKDDDENDIATETHTSIDTEPKCLQFPVSISFPLDEENECNDRGNDKSQGDTAVQLNRSIRGYKTTTEGGLSRFYSETIQWDLGDPESPTPLAFASRIAEEYGLTYIQTLELVDSIQKQINAFVEQNCKQTASIALRGVMSSSPSQHLLDHRPVPVIPNLYGVTTDVGPYAREGYCVPICQKSKQSKLVRLSSTVSNRSTTSKSSEVKEQNRSASRKCNATSNPSNPKGKVPMKRKLSIVNEKPSKPLKQIKKVVSPVEPIYHLQVRSRILTESVEDIQQKGNNAIVFHEACVCHFCQEVKPSCGIFACGQRSHAFCQKHLIEKTFVPASSGLVCPRTLDYCPICSLTCDCTTCVAKLDAVALEFRKRCIRQNVSPKETSFPNLLNYCKHLNGCEKATTIINSDQSKPGKRSTIEVVNPMDVPKVLPSDFPREVAMGVDLDSGYDEYYNKIYTADGIFPVENHHALVSDGNRQQYHAILTDETPKVVEDGNVDYCNTCRAEGNLLCCDFCPRAFHNTCMAEKDRCGVSSEDDDKWECPSCRLEKVVMTEDFLTGEYSIMQVAAAFNDSVNDGDIQKTARCKLLSIVFDMVQRLMDYDFGYMFRVPVDTKQIPSYRNVVKKPMDLGTISSNIMKGTYKDRIRSPESALDDIVVAVLKDIELVWHNCFIFNFEGSAVYRMAEVQQKRATIVRRASFDHLLSDHVKGELTSFIEACENERTSIRRGKTPKTVSRAATAASRYKVKHKISGSSPFRSGKGRPVAVFDSDTGRIVKVYATIQSATKVINFFFDDMNFQCEIMRDKIGSHIKLRNFIDESKTDYRNRLFGYRWLLLDDLRGQRVSFPLSPKTSKKKYPKRVRAVSNSGEDEDLACLIGLIEMIDGDSIYFFNSIEESLSFPGAEAEIASRKEQLVRLSPGFDFRDTAGRIWKKVAPDSSSVVRKMPFFKMDLISDAHLMDFGSIQAAFDDWLQTLDASPEDIEDRSIRSFRSDYLDGNRNVDGICWRTRHFNEIEDARHVFTPDKPSLDILQFPAETKNDDDRLDCTDQAANINHLPVMNGYHSSEVLGFNGIHVSEKKTGDSGPDFYTFGSYN